MQAVHVPLITALDPFNEEICLLDTDNRIPTRFKNGLLPSVLEQVFAFYRGIWNHAKGRVAVSYEGCFTKWCTDEWYNFGTIYITHQHGQLVCIFWKVSNAFGFLLPFSIFDYVLDILSCLRVQALCALRPRLSVFTVSIQGFQNKKENFVSISSEVDRDVAQCLERGVCLSPV